MDYYLQRLRTSFYTIVLADINDAEALTVPANHVQKPYHYAGPENLDAIGFEPKDTSLMVCSTTSGVFVVIQDARLC